MDALPEESIELGKTGIQISPMGTGALAWGERFFWGYGRDYSEADVRQAFDFSLEAGIVFFDTAESYGGGASERLLGKFVNSIKMPAEGQALGGKPPLIATKFFPYPWRLRKASLINALKSSLMRLKVDQVDLYQIHFPLPPVSIDTWSLALAEAVKEGMTRATGVSNYNLSQLLRSHDILRREGIPLASNQVEFSLLQHAVERNGVLHACKELGITLIAYSPLEKGMLTGKYTQDKPPTGIRGRRYSRKYLARIQPLIQVMHEIGHSHGSKTAAQVALNWVICKGAVPIPGAKNGHQIQENAGALGWRLTSDEVAALDRASQEVG